MWVAFILLAAADETGATVDCTAPDEGCVTTGGLPGLCDDVLTCVTESCGDDGDTCAIEGEWGTCRQQGEAAPECRAGGCQTAPSPASVGLLAGIALRTRRRRELR